MKTIAGIPEDVLEAHKAQVLHLKLKAFSLAHSIARLSEEDRKMTGFKNADQVILEAVAQIEKLTRALERKYPGDAT